MRTVHSLQEPAAPPFGAIHEGDTVVVETRDGRRLRFLVQQVDGDVLVAPDGARYTSDDIVRLQRRSFSGTKTTLLVGAAVYVGVSLLFAAAMNGLF